MPSLPSVLPHTPAALSNPPRVAERRDGNPDIFSENGDADRNSGSFETALRREQTDPSDVTDISDRTESSVGDADDIVTTPQQTSERTDATSTLEPHDLVAVASPQSTVSPLATTGSTVEADLWMRSGASPQTGGDLAPDNRLTPQTPSPQPIAAQANAATSTEAQLTSQGTAQATVQAQTQAELTAQGPTQTPLMVISAADGSALPQNTLRSQATADGSSAEPELLSAEAAELDAKVKADLSGSTVKLGEAAHFDRLLSSTPHPADTRITVGTSDLSFVGQSLSAGISTPTLSPITGAGAPLLQTAFQAMTGQPAIVTLDKIPQAVVAVSLTAKGATLQIDPPEMGRIQLDYQFDVQGRTVVTLTPESEAARAALIDRMATITAALEQGGRGAVDVQIADARDFGSTFGQSSEGSSSNGSETEQAQGGSEHIDASQTQQPLQFARAPDGSTERLHIRV